MAFWDVCSSPNGGCEAWDPPRPGEPFGVSGARSDYGVPLPVGTPVQAPVSGVVLPQHPGGGWYSVFGRQSFGGEVDILSNVPDYGGLVNVGVIHLDTAKVKPGQVVRKGDVIGTSGGQTSGGNWPSSPQFSSGPHVGLQVHSPQSWNALQNPGTLMDNLLQGRDTSSVPTQGQLQAAGLSGLDHTLQQAGGQGCDWKTWLACLTGMNPAACAACAHQTVVNGPPNPVGAIVGGGVQAFIAAFPGLSRYFQQPLRILKLIAGGLLLMIGLVVTFLPDILAGGAAAAGVPEASAALQGASRGNLRHRARQGILAAGAIQQRRTLRSTAKKAEERAQRQERREQARERKESVERAKGTIGRPGSPPSVNLARGTLRRNREAEGAERRTRERAESRAAFKRQQGFTPEGKSLRGEDVVEAHKHELKPGQTLSDFLNE